MSAPYEWLDREADVRYEYLADPEAGLMLDGGELWWGTRFRFRVKGDRRWRSFIAVNVHPYDSLAVDAALAKYITQARRLVNVLSEEGSS